MVQPSRRRFYVKKLRKNILWHNILFTWDSAFRENRLQCLFISVNRPCSSTAIVSEVVFANVTYCVVETVLTIIYHIYSLLLLSTAILYIHIATQTSSKRVPGKKKKCTKFLFLFFDCCCATNSGPPCTAS